MTDTPAARRLAVTGTLTAVLAGLAAYGIFFVAPEDGDQGIIQKIFYFHVPAAMMMFLSAFICGTSSAVYLFRGRTAADRVAAAAGELAVVFGMIVLVTGPLWARKAWGVWWQWDARLTSSLLLWMIFVAYLLVRKYGGPGAEKLAAGMAVFGESFYGKKMPRRSEIVDALVQMTLRTHLDPHQSGWAKPPPT